MVIKQFVEQIYAGRKRKNGEPVTTHLYGVMDILAAEGVTEQTILNAALLHDILEDTDLTLDYLSLRFGEKTAKLIDLLSKNPCWNTSYCKMKSSMDEIEVSWLDYPEAMAIKMADRLHNLLTIEGFKTEKQQEYLEETIELLIPVFERTLKKNNLGYLKSVIFNLLKKLRDESLRIYQRLYSNIKV